MEEHLDNLALIESYHQGLLSDEDKINFEVRLISDLALQEENAIYQKMVLGFHDLKLDRLKSKMNEIDEELDNSGELKNYHKKFYWWAGVAACLIFIQFYIYNNQNNIPLPIEEGLPVLMGDNQNVSFDNAMQLFKSGKYEASITRFEKLVILNPENDTLNYFLGYAELQVRQYDAATTHLKFVSTQNTSIFNLKAKYFLAFAYYKNNNSKDAHLLIQELNLNDNNPFKEETQIFSSKLNEN